MKGKTMKKNDQPELSEYQRIYIRMIAKEVGDEVEAKIKPDIEKMNNRIGKIENKVFNGFGSRIKNIGNQMKGLYALYLLILGIVIKVAFFHQGDDMISETTADENIRYNDLDKEELVDMECYEVVLKIASSI